jgi:D-beta-D-heptose 7-phosphate kinase/D-beta-D-heptose 1-phosphate adenosyltransferase
MRRSLDKIRPRGWLVSAVEALKREGKRIVFTNGCFDLLHVGHVRLLEQARQLGDVLVVGINSDRSVRRLKGPSRPIVKERDRAQVLAGLASVDYVTVFDEATPHALIAALKPDVLVKGADWAMREVVGRDVLKRSGGRVVRIPLVKGYSTTSLIERLVRAHGACS